VVKSGGVVEWGTERFPAPSLRASLSTVRVENGGGVGEWQDGYRDEAPPR